MVAEPWQRATPVVLWANAGKGEAAKEEGQHLAQQHEAVA